MAKKMNKILKLTLFLGATALISGGLLTAVHLLTAPIIEKTELNRKYDGYKKVLGIEDFGSVEEEAVSEDLIKAGVTAKSSFYNGDDLLGVVYDVDMRGYAPNVKFQLGIKDDKFVGFNLLSHSETPGFGADLLSRVDTNINRDQPSIDSEIFVGELGTTGVSMTGTPLKNVFTVCASDFKGGN